MKTNEWTLKETIDALKKRSISHQELFTDIESVIERENKNLNIYLSLDKEARQKGEKLLDTPLAGIPIAVKDNFLTRELPSTASSQVLKGFMSPYESTVTRRITEAGGVIIGKTNMDAWAHGSSTESSDFGPTKNPNNPGYLPGGSSGGSAAALAANMCSGALGSETAGSIRQPAAWCGVVGFKPTYGRVPRTGVVAMGSSLDCPGPIGKTVEDTAIILTHIAGHDPYDGTSSDTFVPDYFQCLKKGVKGMKIGMCYIDHEKLHGSTAAKAVESAAKIFSSLGAQVSLIPLSDQLEKGKILTPDYAIGVYTVIQRSEVSSNLARFDGIRFGTDRSFFGEEAKRRIILGTFTLSKGYSDKYYVKAQQVRSLYIRNFSELFQTYDVLMAPTSPGFALPLGSSEKSPMFGELEDMLLEPSSISGLPGISVPCHHDEGTNLDIGLNIIADQWQEEKVFAAANAFEVNTPWNRWRNTIK
jgi:aspartyl-tRNA(Asn)/glutamyl-tRNA(Gln) amidotransferase subunit A